MILWVAGYVMFFSYCKFSGEPCPGSHRIMKALALSSLTKFKFSFVVPICFQQKKWEEFVFLFIMVDSSSVIMSSILMTTLFKHRFTSLRRNFMLITLRV